MDASSTWSGAPSVTARRARRPSCAAIYVQRGIDPVVASEMVNEVMQDPDLAVETHAREELGITRRPGVGLAGRRRLLRDVRRGRFHPPAPWLFTSGTTAVVLSIVLGAVASVAVGIALARFTERPVLVSALRQRP